MRTQYGAAMIDKRLQAQIASELGIVLLRHVDTAGVHETTLALCDALVAVLTSIKDQTQRDAIVQAFCTTLKNRVRRTA